MGRPIIVEVDRKTGRVHAHHANCKGSRDHRIPTKIAGNTEELGYGRSRMVLKADQ